MEGVTAEDTVFCFLGSTASPGEVFYCRKQAMTVCVASSCLPPQTLVIAMNVIRMIKLFGWELKMSHRLADKRQDELSLVTKFKYLTYMNVNIKYEAFYSNPDTA